MNRAQGPLLDDAFFGAQDEDGAVRRSEGTFENPWDLPGGSSDAAPDALSDALPSRVLGDYDEYGGADEPAELCAPELSVPYFLEQRRDRSEGGSEEDAMDEFGKMRFDFDPKPNGERDEEPADEPEELEEPGEPEEEPEEEPDDSEDRDGLGATDDAEEGSDEEPADEPEEPEEEPFDIDAIDPRERRGAWVEIDTRSLAHNVGEFKKRVGPRVRIMAVVKADAYGHGAVECAKVALRAGATWLGVATVDEALELRRAGISERILVLSQPPAATIPALVQNRIAPAVHSVEFAMELGEYAASRGVAADYHLCINTGMNRIGIWYADVADFMALISFHIGLNLEGTFTHFATADAHEDYVFTLQLRRFKEALAQLKGLNINPGVVHCANSAAAIRYKESHFDMVRVGISLYGLHPSTVTRKMIELWPVMSVHARITAINDVPVGEGVSYSMSYRSPGNVKICTLPIGYADGLSRQLSNRMSVIYKSKFFPQVGNICMDQCMFEVDKRSTLLNPAVEPLVGDEVIIVGRTGDYILHLDDMADALGTINYELACRFGMRLPRIYV